jgi:hypothetical protein
LPLPWLGFDVLIQESVDCVPMGARPLDKGAQFLIRRLRQQLRAIRVIGKLGNKSAYEYDDADVKKIISALSKELDALKCRLGQKNNKGEVEFKL